MIRSCSLLIQWLFSYTFAFLFLVPINRYQSSRFPGFGWLWNSNGVESWKFREKYAWTEAWQWIPMDEIKKLLKEKIWGYTSSRLRQWRFPKRQMEGESQGSRAISSRVSEPFSRTRDSLRGSQPPRRDYKGRKLEIPIFFWRWYLWNTFTKLGPVKGGSDSKVSIRDSA